MMRYLFIGAFGITGVHGVLLSEAPETDDDFLTPPSGVAFTGNPDHVECEGEVDISKKELLATIFHCGEKIPADLGIEALCQPYMKGGCDSEVVTNFVTSCMSRTTST